MRGQHQPGLFLGAGPPIAALIVNDPPDPLDQRRNVVGFGRKRQKAGPVTQTRSVIAAVTAAVFLASQQVGCGGKHRLGAAAITEQGERGGKLASRQGRTEFRKFGIREVA